VYSGIRWKTARRHTSADFVAFLAEVVAQTQAGKEIHIVLDNLSAHKTGGIDADVRASQQ
jgi:transposase